VPFVSEALAVSVVSVCPDQHRLYLTVSTRANQVIPMQVTPMQVTRRAASRPAATRCSTWVLALALMSSYPALGQEQISVIDALGMDDPIAYAESAGIPEIAAEATVLDADGNVLREGTNTWTCVAVPQAPMCVDPQWMALMSALMSGDEEFKASSVGLSYMLRGDAGASNTDPFATGPSPDNDWVVTGPHIMLISPDPGELAGIPTEPSGGGPYVMWSGTAFAHVMIPVEGDAVRMPEKGQ